MARKKKHEEHVNHERWLVSYADFITLLFAFFTSLYAISTVDAKKAGKMVFSTRAAFNVDFFPTDKPTLGFSNPTEVQDIRSVKVQRERVVPDIAKSKKGMPATPDGVSLKTLRSVFDEINKTVVMRKIDGVSVLTNRYGLVVSLKDAAFFEPSTANIKQQSLPALDFLAEKLLATHLDVRVEGHTDGTFTQGSRYRSNWELSTARAASVVTYFIEQFAYPPEQLSVAGYASNKPTHDNDTAAGRAANRRVDIVLLTPHRETETTPSEATGQPAPREPDPPTGMQAPQGPGLPIEMPK